MTIAFDFDGTITVDPPTMIAVMRCFRDAGWMVIVATLRCDTESEAVERLLGTEFPVVYCARNTKALVCKMLGFDVAVWVDDMPETCREVLLIGKDREL